MCQVLGMSASGYYAWRERPECLRAKANHALLEDIRIVHAVSEEALAAVATAHHGSMRFCADEVVLLGVPGLNA